MKNKLTSLAAVLALALGTVFMAAPGADGQSRTSRYLLATGDTLAGAFSWTTGLGAIDHLLGPSDQNLSIQPGAARNTILADNGGTTQVTVATTGVTLATGTITTMSGATSLTGTITGSSAGQVRLTNGVMWFDDFTAEVWDTNEYTTNTDADPTVVVAIVEGAAGVGGYLSMAADDVDNDKQEIAGALSFSSSLVTVFECRIAIAADVTETKVNIGLSDAKNEAANTIAFEIGASDTVTEAATDAVCFVYDTDADTDGWFGCIAGTTDEDEGAGATVPVAGTYQTLRFEIDSSRKVTFYIDGVAYGSQTTAALDASKSLCFYFATESTTTAARTINVDYVYIWQKRT